VKRLNFLFAFGGELTEPGEGKKEKKKGKGKGRPKSNALFAFPAI